MQGEDQVQGGTRGAVRIGERGPHTGQGVQHHRGRRAQQGLRLGLDCSPSHRDWLAPGNSDRPGR